MKVSLLFTLLLTFVSIAHAETTTQLTNAYIQCQFRNNCSASADRNQCANACLHEVHQGVVAVEKETGSNSFPLPPPPPKNNEAEISKLLFLMMLTNSDPKSKPVSYPAAPPVFSSEQSPADDDSSS